MDATAGEAEALGQAPPALVDSLRRLRTPMVKAPTDIGGDQLGMADQQRYFEALAGALALGRDMLKRGASSLDTVEAVVRALEDDPLFNAGRGAVFTHEGQNEMDAAVMDGATRDAGAVAGVRLVRNPVRLARETVWYQPAHIQRRSVMIKAAIGEATFLRFLGVASFFNALCRISFVAGLDDA